ncbi:MULTISPECIES: serine/threonine-protein kinase [Spirulina sp. CCY15215]|uniref:serine/threonine-protein kinase n=1 Tax=Spirulina sp. CCY15215 TaxID=2767591 RepID=UPI00195071C4|nr:serine/threonine-protein kinase [Spirulina major]
MAYCLNPECTQPQNSKGDRSCKTCGSSLLLKERYRALSALGQGGFGRTFLGIDEHFPKHPTCVIKQLYLQQATPEVHAKAMDLFQQEAVRLSELGNHPQIPTLYAYFSEQGYLFLVQEYIPGPTLNMEAWQKVRNKEEKIWQLLRDILPVLKFIHDRQVIHRDIKPENIMERAENGQIVLIDFGVARLFTGTAMMGGATIIGTPGFMSPEQMRGKVLPASDLYSLGATCLNLLVGVHPDHLFDVIEERWKWRDRLPGGMQISAKLTKVLNHLVEPSLRQRAQSAEEVMREIGNIPLQNQPLSPSPTTQIPKRLTPQQLITNPQQRTQAMSLPLTSKPSKMRGLMPRQTSVGSEVELEDLRLKLSGESEESQVRIDYTRLKALLSRKRWKEADEETRDILCTLMGKRAGTYLFNKDIQKLPCKDLKAIDYLWFKSSQGRFGFQVQKQIYEEVGKEYDLFCQQVGWPVHDEKSHAYLQFNLRSPIGHLPSRSWVGGVSWWKHADILAARLDRCGYFLTS